MGLKFEHPGIYCILLDGKPVYVGKSKNMLLRMAQHYTKMAEPTDHKYRLLAEAVRLGHTIRFRVLYYALSKDKAAIENEIGEKEGEYIRKYQTPLNYQIPKAEDWRKYDTNPQAQRITLQELLQ